MILVAKKLYFCHPRESSSAGRARPCQGRGRGFESRLSLCSFFNSYSSCENFLKYLSVYCCPGGGTGRHAGLKILWPLRPCRFDPGSGYTSKTSVNAGVLLFFNGIRDSRYFDRSALGVHSIIKERKIQYQQIV